MMKDEELQALREENRTLKALVAELLPLKEQLAQATARIKELEERLAKDSRTSSKPPSSDGLARLPRSSRRPSGKRPGGQAGHAGRTLAIVEQPDDMVRHRRPTTVCRQCGEALHPIPGIVAECRQVLDLPDIHLVAHEHQLEAICCPSCRRTSLGSFPPAVSAPVQYGPNVQALAVYLHQGQLLPTARTCEALAALCGCQIAEATLLQWSELAAERLEPTVERIAELLVASEIQHGDETGIRVYGMVHWLHVNCTRFLTHLTWHASRGRTAMFEILAAGYAAQPPPPTSTTEPHKRRRKQSKAKNLLDALLMRAEQVLALLDDLHIPFTNNQAERDLRWAKVQQKISGTFRRCRSKAILCSLP